MVQCGMSIKPWDDQLREAIQERRGIHKKHKIYESVKTLEQYTAKKKQVQVMETRSSSTEVNEDLEGGVKHMWQGINGTVCKSGEGGKTVVAMLRAVHGRLVSSGKSKRELLERHYGRLGVPSGNATFEKVFKEEVDVQVEREKVASKENSGTEEL